MAIDKKKFLQEITIIVDTREQKNSHITDKLQELEIPFASRALDYGDYSFITKNRDFTLNCVIERKANIDELYGNFTKDRERIENEFNKASRHCNDFILLIEDCSGMNELKNFTLSNTQMARLPMRQVAKIGELVYCTLMSWRCGNRYKFYIEFVKNKDSTACKILEVFYYYWKNYKTLTQAKRGENK